MHLKRNMQNKYFRSFVFILGLCILGCATVKVPKGSKEIYFTYEDEGLKGALAESVKGVQVDKVKTYRIGVIEDKRTSDSIHPTLKEKNITEWIEQGLFALTSGNITIVNSAEQRNDRIIDVEIMKLYITSQSTSMTANVVLELAVKNKDSIIFTKVYRGSNTSVNWAGGSDEIISCFNKAYEELLYNFYKDVISE